MNDEMTGVLVWFTLIVLALVGWGTISHVGATNNGQHTGYVTAVEQEGLIWKTWRAYVKTDPQSSQEDSYCVSDPNVVNQLQDAERSRALVNVNYTSPWLVWKWQCGGEGSIINTIQPSNNVGNNNTASDQASISLYLNLQAQCATQGQAFFQKFRASANTGAETTWQPPEYHFNTRLQTCLVAWQNGGVLGGVDWESGAVIDIWENKEILGENAYYQDLIPQKNILMSE